MSPVSVGFSNIIHPVCLSSDSLSYFSHDEPLVFWWRTVACPPGSHPNPVAACYAGQGSPTKERMIINQ